MQKPTYPLPLGFPESHPQSCAISIEAREHLEEPPAVSEAASHGVRQPTLARSDQAEWPRKGRVNNPIRFPCSNTDQGEKQNKKLVRANNSALPQNGWIQPKTGKNRQKTYMYIDIYIHIDIHLYVCIIHTIQHPKNKERSLSQQKKGTKKRNKEPKMPPPPQPNGRFPPNSRDRGETGRKNRKAKTVFDDMLDRARGSLGRRPRSTRSLLLGSPPK